MRVASSHLRGVPSGAVPPPPSSIGVDATETSGVATVDADADVPPPTASDDSDI